MNYDPSNLAPSLQQQLTIPDRANSKSSIIAKCGCGISTTINYRAFLRRWSTKQQYLCKSCHIKSYASSPERVSKFRASFRVAASDQGYRAKCAANGRAAWQDQETRQRISRAVSIDNRTNPKKVVARQIALAALQSKDWFSLHLAEMRTLAIEQTKSSANEFIAKAIKIHGDYYGYELVVYSNSISNVTIVCPRHGRFDQSPHSHLQGKGCRHCSSTITSPHQTVIDMLPSGVEIEINSKRELDPLEIDVWLPGHRLGIEINGEYWHGVRAGLSQAECRHQRIRHQLKAQLAQQAGLKLFQFWADEISNNRCLVKSMINNALGLSKPVAARACRKERLTNEVAAEFFAVNHLQGHRPALYTYALTVGDQVMCALSFSKHPRHQWEIMRYAAAMDTVVVGGFSRLLTMFIDEHRPTEIMTFADRRISTGAVYLLNGFELVKSTLPNYFYWGRSGKLSRQRCQKSKLPKLLGGKYIPELTEVDNMLSASYTQVFDAGHYKLVRKF